MEPGASYIFGLLRAIARSSVARRQQDAPNPRYPEIDLLRSTGEYIARLSFTRSGKTRGTGEIHLVTHFGELLFCLKQQIRRSTFQSIDRLDCTGTHPGSHFLGDRNACTSVNWQAPSARALLVTVTSRAASLRRRAGSRMYKSCDCRQPKATFTTFTPRPLTETLWSRSGGVKASAG